MNCIKIEFSKVSEFFIVRKTQRGPVQPSMIGVNSLHQSTKQLEQKETYEIEGLANYEIGFSKVIEEIIRSKKPLIGHNMFLDMLFIYQQFIDDLPNSLGEFIPKVTFSR